MKKRIEKNTETGYNPILSEETMKTKKTLDFVEKKLEKKNCVQAYLDDELSQKFNKQLEKDDKTKQEILEAAVRKYLWESGVEV